MKPTERDALLVRLDERSVNTWNMMEKQETHLNKINGSVQKCLGDIASNKTNIRNIWKVIGGFATLLAIAIPILLAVFGVY